MTDSNVTGKKNKQTDASALRRRAEEIAAEKLSPLSEKIQKMSLEEMGRILHELQVHQIELTMQNEELRRAEEELEAARERYFDLYDLAPVGSFTLSEQGLILESNLTAATLLGVARGQLAKQPISRFILKEDRDIYYLHQKQLFETGEPQECDLRLVKPDGAYFWAHLTGTAAQAEEGAPVCRVVLSDITERKKAEEEIIRTAQEWQLTFDSSNDMIWLLDSEQRVVRSNKTSERYFKRPCGELAGIHCWEIVHGTTKPIPECPAPRAKKSLRRETMELQIGNGWFRVTVDPIFNAAGQYKGAVHTVRDITEHRLLEDQLQASEARLRAVTDSTPFPMAIVDVEDDKIEYWSRSALELFGHTAPTTTEWYQLAYPDPEYRREVIAHWKPFLEKARRSGKPVNTGEYRVTCHDGSERLCELYASFLSDRLIVTFNDITERKKAEELLRLKNHVFDTSIAANSIADIDGVITEANDSFQKIWGYSSKDEVIGHPISYFLNAPEEAVAIVNALNKNGNWQGNFTAKKKDGSTFIAHTMATAIRDKYGKVTGYQSSVMDITEHKRAEENLREKESQYRNLADTGFALIWTAGTDKLCNYFNKPWLKFTGRTLEQEMGNGWTEGVHPDDLDRCVKTYVTAFDKREAFDMEYRLRHASGEYRWLRDLGTPNYNVSGEFIGYIGHCFDITEQKTAEDVIKTLNENLEQRIKERTVELKQKIAELEELNRSFVGRELRMIELKERIAELEKQKE